MEDFGRLTTEAHRGDLSDLDRRSTAEIVRLMSEEAASVPAAVSGAAAGISAAVDAITERLSGGGRLIYVGAGTSGRLGVLDAAECWPTFNTRQVIGLIAGGPRAMTESVEGAEDDVAAGAGDLDEISVSEADAVAGISASGRTPYVLGAVRRAREIGALTVGIACNPGSALGSAVDCPIEAVVGPEVIAGSTRLKAGAAQKLILNTISTAVMIRLGKTYENFMVDLRASNEKLRGRACRIVAATTGASPESARCTLDESDDEVKTAIVMLLAGVDTPTARRRLAAAGGFVGRAVEGA